jgi:aspartyl-tRNA(Asn)/glutamyl-tRNA(Gln) amidotransferase subunit B
VNVDTLVQKYGLTAKDAITLLSLDDGKRLDYFHQIVLILVKKADKFDPDLPYEFIGKMTGNW